MLITIRYSAQCQCPHHRSQAVGASVNVNVNVNTMGSYNAYVTATHMINVPYPYTQQPKLSSKAARASKEEQGESWHPYTHHIA